MDNHLGKMSEYVLPQPGSLWAIEDLQTRTIFGYPAIIVKSVIYTDVEDDLFHIEIESTSFLGTIYPLKIFLNCFKIVVRDEV